MRSRERLGLTSNTQAEVSAPGTEPILEDISWVKLEQKGESTSKSETYSLTICTFLTVECHQQTYCVISLVSKVTVTGMRFFLKKTKKLQILTNLLGYTITILL